MLLWGADRGAWAGWRLLGDAGLFLCDALDAWSFSARMAEARNLLEGEFVGGCKGREVVW